MIVGILDFETTSLDTLSCVVNEHAVILADLDEQGDRPPHVLAIDTALWLHHEPIPEELQKLNGITPKLLLDHGHHPSVLRPLLFDILSHADVLVGHNLIQYDREILARLWLEDELSVLKSKVFAKPVIDTKFDVPITGKSSSLTYMAADYGIANPNAHRALFDCETVLALLGKMNRAAIAQAIERSKEDLVEVVTRVDFMNKDAVKDRGYYWKPEDKTWRKVMRLSDSRLETPAADRFGFQIITIRPVDLPLYRKVMSHGNG